MEVAELHDIVVDDRELADARTGERRDHRTADASRADHRDPRFLELALADAADLRQHDVPRIAFQLLIGDSPPGDEAPGSAACLTQFRNLAESRLLDGRRHELRDALAPTDLERLAAEIGEDNLHFATIIVIDRARRVEAGDAVLQRKSGARTTWTSYPSGIAIAKPVETA